VLKNKNLYLKETLKITSKFVLLKRLYQLIIKTFIPPFLATFLVTWFVFIMQFFWLYIDDFVGKGLDTLTILQLIGYLAPTIVPMALPLGVLLAGIMTFGNIAESSELTAIKSSGISLIRFSKPLIVFVGGVSLLAFLFNNYAIPVANLKFWTLLMDVRNTKPAVNLKAGVFYNDIPGFSIYINSKDANNKTIHDCMIYDQTSGKGNDKVILAKKGEMYVSADKKYLIFELSDGCRYEEKAGKVATDKEQIRLNFKYWKKIFDLSSFAMQKSNENYLNGNEIMLSNQELNKRADSMQKKIRAFTNDNKNNFKPYIALVALDSVSQKFIPIQKNIGQNNSLKSNMGDSLYNAALGVAQNNARSVKGLMEIFKNDSDIQENNLRLLKIEWHKKITLALSCLILFLIGAPLGAIIKKGGFGLPFVSAVVFFVIYRFMNVFSEKLAKQGEISCFMGLWAPLFILAIIAFILFYKANNDAQIINTEAIKRFYNSLFKYNKK
jgi:lipopolysaccharide export system permease protein